MLWEMLTFFSKISLTLVLLFVTVLLKKLQYNLLSHVQEFLCPNKNNKDQNKPNKKIQPKNPNQKNHQTTQN